MSVFLTFTLIFSAGCGPEKVRTIRIGFNSRPGYELFYLAETKGFYAEEGVAVKLVELSSVGDVRRAFERGQVDVMASSLVEVILAQQQSQCRPRVFYVTDYSDGSHVLLARRSAPDVAALKGKRIGLEPGSLDVLLLYEALKAGGLSMQDVQIVPLSQMSLPDAFARGEVDGVQTYPPFSDEILNRDDSHVVFDTRQISGRVLDVLAVHADLLPEHREDLAAITRAFERAYQDMLRNPREVQEIIARRRRVSIEDLDALVRGIQIVGVDEQPLFLARGGALEHSLVAVSQDLADMGLISQTPDPRRLITTELFDEAIEDEH